MKNSQTETPPMTQEMFKKMSNKNSTNNLLESLNFINHDLEKREGKFNENVKTVSKSDIQEVYEILHIGKVTNTKLKTSKKELRIISKDNTK